MAFGGHAWRQSCRVCKSTTNKDAGRLRLEWGCEAPTPAAQFEVACPFCEGLDPACADCGGRGRLEFHRCPFSLIGPEHLAVCRAADLLAHGLLPAAGGWAEQAAPFVDALLIVRRLQAEYQRKAQEDAQRRARERAKRGR